jgi:hypothetical protein
MLIFGMNVTIVIIQCTTSVSSSQGVIVIGIPGDDNVATIIMHYF